MLFPNFFFVADAQIVSEIQGSMLMLKLYLLKRVLSAPPRCLCAPYSKRDEAYSKLYISTLTLLVSPS